MLIQCKRGNNNNDNKASEIQQQRRSREHLSAGWHALLDHLSLGEKVQGIKVRHLLLRLYPHLLCQLLQQRIPSRETFCGNNEP